MVMKALEPIMLGDVFTCKISHNFRSIMVEIVVCTHTHSAYIHVYHYTKITVVRPYVPEADRPRCKKLCFSAKLKPDTTSRRSLTRPATALAPF